MRLFEITTIILLFSLVCVANSKKAKYYISLSLLTSLFWHIIEEQVLWQFFGIYFISVLTLFYATRHRYMSKTYYILSDKSKKIAIIITFFIVTLSATLRIFTPQIKLLPPTGKYLVSTELHHFKDETRLSPFDKEKDKARKIRAKVWFPAQRISLLKPLVTDLYWNENPYKYTRELTKLLNIPSIMMSHLYDVQPHSYKYLSISTVKEKFPVVILSHGYMSSNEISNTQLAEELASHGYIVVAINHMSESLISWYKKDTVTVGNADRAQEVAKESSIVMKLFSHARRKKLNREKIIKTYNEFIEYPKTISLWKYDIKFVIDQLADLNYNLKNKEISGHMDLDKIAVIGFSMGGIASMEASYIDSRIKTVINMDGPSTKQSFTTPVPVPFLQMSSLMFKDINKLSIHEDSTHFHYIFDDANHNNFEDLSMFFPLVSKYVFGSIGSVDTKYHIQRMRDFSVSFLNSFLLESESFTLPQAESKTGNTLTFNDSHTELDIGERFNPTVIPPYQLVNDAIENKNVQHALIIFDSLQTNHSQQLFINENLLNKLGYEYLNTDVNIAIELFKANTLYYPESANCFDSLGEAYIEKSDISLAIINFKKALDLNPKFESSIKHLNILENL